MASRKIIRLWRRGHKNYPLYHIVVIFSHKRGRGPFFERLGFFNPNLKERQLAVKTQRLAFWLNRGAYLHPSVTKLLGTFTF